MNDGIIDKAREALALLFPAAICKGEERQIERLIQRLEHQEITVAVIGQFKRGKTTLINAILGEQLLPVGIIPVTAAVTRIRYGEPHAMIHFENGTAESVEYSQLSHYISEQSNPDNRLGVASVSLETPAPFLQEGLILVDTPGVGSFHQHNSEAAYAFVRESDSVIFMLSADSPINQIEIDFLKNVKEYAGKFYFVVNKIDTLSQEELTAYVEYCSALLCRLLESEQVNILPVSARRGDGIDSLIRQIQTDCRTSARSILENSVRLKLIRLIDESLARIRLYWNAIQLPPRKFKEQFQKMNDCFVQAKQRAEVIEAELAGGPPVPISAGLPLFYKNEIKRYLSSCVSQFFGFEYSYETEEWNLSDSSQSMIAPEDRLEAARQFREEIGLLCCQLSDTLNSILLYREESVYVVSRRIEDLREVIRRLGMLRDSMK